VAGKLQRTPGFTRATCANHCQQPTLPATLGRGRFRARAR
jgi:hypothetical protein